MGLHRALILIPLGMLWLGCQTSLDASERDRDYEASPVEPMDETVEWAEDDVNR